MSTGAKAIIILAAVVVALLAARVAGLGGVSEELFSLSGEVVSVDTSRDPSRPDLRQAVVKLETGEKVRAIIPAACVVLPGQIARLARFEHTIFSSPGYMVLDTKDKSDS